jgi:imidazolonepropionase-like amidohydrolase
VGTVEEGKRADLIVIAGDPLQDPEVFADPSNIPLVVQNGSIVKDLEAGQRASIPAAAR